MDRWVGKIALVTGANSGIGAAIARSLAKNGMNVVGADKSIDTLKQMMAELSEEKGTLTPYLCDLSQDDQVASLFKFIEEKFKAIHVCVNNAGIVNFVSLMEGTPKIWRDLLDVNLVAVCHCSKLSVEIMRRHGINDGHIINISSAYGYKVPAYAGQHFYSATKFGVRAITEGLRYEMREAKSSIRVTGIAPDYVDTNIMDRQPDGPAFKEIAIKSFDPLQPKDIADTVIHILERPPHVQLKEVIISPTDHPEY